MFTHVEPPRPKYNWIRETREGKRVYVAEGKEDLFFPSITTVLGSIKDESLDEWKKRVGEKEANRISRIATHTGTQLHRACELYLQNVNPFSNRKTPFLPCIPPRFNRFRALLDRIDNVYLLEKSMASLKLGVSGTVDCIAEFDGVLSVIDFKTSKKPKPRDWIKTYFLQETAYAVMAYETYDLRPTQLVTLISVEHDEDQVFIERPKDHYNDLVSVIQEYKRGLN